MKNIFIRILLTLPLIGMGYVSYNLHTINNYAEEREIAKKIMTGKKIDEDQKSELINELESELKETDRLNYLIYILDASILIFMLGLFLTTPKRKTNANNGYN